jgi:hypothetical protein
LRFGHGGLEEGHRGGGGKESKSITPNESLKCRSELTCAEKTGVEKVAERRLFLQQWTSREYFGSKLSQSALAPGHVIQTGPTDFRLSSFISTNGDD